MISQNEVEKIRLTLSTFQDGTGQIGVNNGLTLPGWRDFERTTALAFGGQAQESKTIFDVIVPIPDSDHFFGISCKMRNTLQSTKRSRRATLELSNSSGRFWNELKTNNITEKNYESNLDKAGKLIINLVESWHKSVSIEEGGNIDINRSFYLLMQWHQKSGDYQLYQFPLKFPNPEELNWQVLGKRLIGKDKNSNKLFEWYGFSGGQLKYYPSVDDAQWVSEVFKLEPLPASHFKYSLQQKVIEYFPELWKKMG
jgi:hypothetical protein